MKKLSLLILVLMLPISHAFAHGGGLDKDSCHFQKYIGRHCHGENAGKYIPEPEEKRKARQHKETCNATDANGQAMRYDYYGKPCRSRSK